MDPTHNDSAVDPTKEAHVPPPIHPPRTNSSNSIHKLGHGHSSSISGHRQSLVENLRGMPASPRSQRHPSFTQAAVQDLMNHPPAQRSQNPRFAGRDWRDVSVGELVSREDVKWVEMDTSVEDATKVSVHRFVQRLSRTALITQAGATEEQSQRCRPHPGGCLDEQTRLDF
jgi:hypothetical protein